MDSRVGKNDKTRKDKKHKRERTWEKTNQLKLNVTILPGKLPKTNSQDRRRSPTKQPLDLEKQMKSLPTRTKSLVRMRNPNAALGTGASDDQPAPHDQQPSQDEEPHHVALGPGTTYDQPALQDRQPSLDDVPQLAATGPGKDDQPAKTRSISIVSKPFVFEVFVV
jgi:hypothetical protein